VERISGSFHSQTEPGAGAFPAGSVFRAALDAVIVMDAGGWVRDWNPAAEQLFGWSREEAVGQELAELVIPGPLRDAHRNGLRRYLETGDTTILDRRLELSALHRDRSEFPVELSVTRLPDLEPPLFAGFLRDVRRERSRIEQENVHLQQRMAFLAQVGLVLDSSLEFEETLHQLVELVVPELARIAVVDLLDGGGMIRTAVAAAEDPAEARAVEAMRRQHPLRLDSPHPVAEVLRTGQPSLQSSITSEFQRRIAQSPEHYELMRRLRYRSAVVVPLVARHRVLGTLSLVRAGDGDFYQESDLALAGELARRAALAIDNARLFEATRDLARTLQDSLLPSELPVIPGVRITGRYRAAAQGQEVGGDFYDVFVIEDGRWGIAIGDVCGKGPEAAALTAFARYTIRALADTDPAELLRQLNESALREPPLLPEQLVTVLFAVARREAEELVVEVASAGHPPPLVRRASGRVERPSPGGPLIGLSQEPEYRREVVRLGPGDALILYTDGLTDARAPAEMLDERQLAELVARAPAGGSAELAEFLESSATAGEDPRDDIALLVIEREP
jgi:PAS domain S-box-containing protein